MPSDSHKIRKNLLHFLPKSPVPSKMMRTQHFPLEERIIMITKDDAGSSPLCAFHSVPTALEQHFSTEDA